MRRVIALDPLTGTLAYVDYDESEDTFRYVQEVDPTAIIEANKQAFNDAPAGWGEGRVVARIPMPLWWDLKQQGIIDDEKAYKRWLNDQQNRHFRTRGGTV